MTVAEQAGGEAGLEIRLRLNLLCAATQQKDQDLLGPDLSARTTGTSLTFDPKATMHPDQMSGSGSTESSPIPTTGMALAIRIKE